MTQTVRTKLRARVFALHPDGFSGYARTAENVRIHIGRNAFLPGSAKPALGGLIEFYPVRDEDGLSAEEISVVVDNEPPGGQLIDSWEEDLPAEEQVGVESVPAPDRATPESNRATKLYQLATVARAEGRINDARALFEQAITAGAAPPVYGAYAKMEMEKRASSRARAIIDRALAVFPTAPMFYVMKGQMERRAGRARQAEKIFRLGLSQAPGDVLLLQSLARALADIGTVASFKEADKIIEDLEQRGKVNTGDQAYQRFRAFRNSPRAARAYAFFDRLSGFRVGIPGKRELPRHITDLIVEISNQELESAFGVTGAYLVRCFDVAPQKNEIRALLETLRTQSEIGLTAGREVAVSNTMAFVVVPGTAGVRDQFMSVLSENNEALVPLDDGNLSTASKQSPDVLRQLLAQFLGSRDLYVSTLPVSGRRFFGRERLLVQLADQIHRGEFIGVFGLRKMGKTSLIYQLRDEKLRDDAVAYIDLQASAALLLKSFGPIYWEIERELAGRCAHRWPNISKHLRLAQYGRFSDVPFDSARTALIFSEDMRDLLNAIASGSSKGVRRVVIVLDELERLLPINKQAPVEGYLEFFALLRGLAQTEAFRGSISSVVVAANALISEKAYWEGVENPVFALYQSLLLPPFSQGDTFRMVANLGKGMGVYWPENVLEVVFQEMGGHPFLTRQFCSRLIKRFPQRPLQVSHAMVQETVNAFVREETDKFEQIIELLHTYFPDEERMLEACALGQTSLATGEQALRHLVGYRLLDVSGDQPTVTPNALRRWLRRRAGLPS
jgi:tetratricopeptide (TPR) repeat protein